MIIVVVKSGFLMMNFLQKTMWYPQMHFGEKHYYRLYHINPQFPEAWHMVQYASSSKKKSVI